MKRRPSIARADSARTGRNEGTARVEQLEARQMYAESATTPDVAPAASTGAAPAALDAGGPSLAAAATLGNPSIRSTLPAPGATGVDPTAADVIAYVNLPNEAGVTKDPDVLAGNVRLYRVGHATPVPASVNTTGAGDAITLTPLSALRRNTAYRFEVTAGLTDEKGAAFQPYAMTFTTGVETGQPPPGIGFDKVALPTATGRRFSGVTIGPDRRLYAGTMDGEIVRFDVAADGTLGPAAVIDAIRDSYGGARRIVTGIRFDPASTATDLALWVSHGDGAEAAAPEWTGALSRLSGPDLTECSELVSGLPRSVRDHLTQQMDFGPDGMLYVSQGSTNAMGAPDNAWGQRPERLLTAAILRIDTAALLARRASGADPLNVKNEGDEAYNPFAPNAPVSLHATGVRNSYDLVWHSNHHLYAPTNGSAPGGNTPAGPGIPGLTNVPQNEPDWLFDIKPGHYYGHPNPSRNEFVLNGGNPTAAADPFEVSAYPVGTPPDADWDPAVLAIGDNRAPTGVIEYKSDAFGGRLRGSLLICEYSAGNDLVAIKLDADGNVAAGDDAVLRGMPGTTGLVDPVDLVEHVGTGNLYVVEYGEQRITLLRPAERPAPVRQGRIVFNDPAGGPASPRRKVTVKNPTAAVMSVAEIGVVGRDEGMFRVVGSPSLPLSLPAGGRVDVWVEFDPSTNAAAGLKTAALRITPADVATPAVEVALRGLATPGEGGANEPSLQRVFDLFELPIDAGDADPSTSDMPLPLAAPNDAIDVQTLVKAGDGPVTVDVLSVFASAGSPTIRFGHYDPAGAPGGGDDVVLSEVLTVTDSQRTKPALSAGGTTFDPGPGEFGLYTTAPRFGTTAYSEDHRNVFEPVESDRRKALFYPITEWDGVAVTDAFVVAFEEVTGSYDFQDFVAVIRNVRPAGVPATPEPELTLLLDGAELPAGTTIDFGHAAQSGPAPERTITLRNDGAADLALGTITLPAGFEWITPFSPAMLAPGAGVTMRVAMSTSTPGDLAGPLLLASNDADEAQFTLRLSGTVDPLPVPPPDHPPVVISDASVARRRTLIRVRIALQNITDEKFTGPATLVLSAQSDVRQAIPTTVGTPTTRLIKLRPHASKVLTLTLPLPTSAPAGSLTITLTVAGITRSYRDGAIASMKGGGTAGE